MNNRNARGLLLVVGLLFVPSAAGARPPLILSGPGTQPSHRPLDDGSGDSLEASLSDRLRQLRDAREMLQLAKRLLSNDDFIKDLQNIPPETLARLRDKVERGEGLGGEIAFQQILDRARAKNHVSPEEAKKLGQFVQASKPPELSSPGPTSTPQPQPGPAPPGTTPAAVPPPPPPPPTSPFARLKEEGTSWLRERMTDLPDGVADLLDRMGEGALGESVRDALRSLGRGGMDEQGLPSNLQELFRDLAGKMSTVGEYLPSDPVPWHEIGSLFQGLRAPSLPSFEGSSDSAASLAPGGDGPGMVWLWLAVVVVFAFILYRSAQRRRAVGEETGWRLGPWPVAPGAVATRGDLVAAFEYLAFLCLGPAARACNHLDVADRLGEQSADAERQRAADELARLYEQARYAPGDEPLTETDLAAARRDLCLLAGVATA